MGNAHNIPPEISRVLPEIRRHFDVAVERIETRVDLVSESIMQVDQKLDRSVARLAGTIESTAAETQAMVRFSPL